MSDVKQDFAEREEQVAKIVSLLFGAMSRTEHAGVSQSAWANALFSVAMHTGRIADGPDVWAEICENTAACLRACTGDDPETMH